MKKVVVLMLGVLVFTGCFAQRSKKKSKKNEAQVEVAPPVKDTPPADELVVTEECYTNLSLFNESAKNKQFADALEPWNQVFNNCPAANRAIYSQGRLIVQWELSQQKDDASYQKVFDKLMLMYDKRMKYFGTDDKYPTAWIKGIKALDYVIYAKNDELKKKAYQWLEESIDGMGNNTEIEVLRQFVVLSDKLYAADKAHAEKYIQDYLKANVILEAMSKDAANKNAELAGQYKNGLDIVFAQSGAADCATLDNLYKTPVSNSLTDLSYLNKVVSFYKRVRCVDSEVYFSAAVAAHKIEPSAESANACAAMSLRKDEYQSAISFLEEATRLSDNNEDKSDFQYKIAQIYYSKLGNYPKTKTHALNSIGFVSTNGNAYLLIGLSYANAKGIFSDDILSKTVFWAAVDKFNKAKQIDPNLAKDANELIGTYSRYFPSKEDIFMHPDLGAGKSFYVGGWIGENTVCR
ncbi:MAG: hypothetical protein K9G42_11875 [Pedobacter sp.]|nr:hypothetical protein [Pedobacter sp.]